MHRGSQSDRSFDAKTSEVDIVLSNNLKTMMDYSQRQVSSISHCLM